MARLGTPPPWPRSFEASRLDAMRALWTDAGLVRVETRTIAVERTFDDFENYWALAQSGPRIAPKVAAMGADRVAVLKDRLRARLSADARRRITVGAVVNVVTGDVPGI